MHTNTPCRCTPNQYKLLLLVFALALFAATPGVAQEGVISGTVTEDETGDPIIGVNVAVEGTTQGDATDSTGTYVISGIEPGTHTVRATSLSYGDVTEGGVEVTANQTTTVDLVMQEGRVGLDELVVIGYGEQTRRDLTGSVSVVPPNQIERATANSVDELLQGRVPGVNVTRSSEPGGGISVRIRGTGSISGDAEPLYVIDGMPMSNASAPGTGSAETGPNPLATINPQAVESIEVLNGVSATAIYGSRGSNGVVLITTKQGQQGQTRINFTTSISSETVNKKYDLLNASQFATLANEVTSDRYGDRFLLNADTLGEGTSWQDVVYDPALAQEYSLAVRGGDRSTTFALSGDYTNENGVIRGSGFERYSLYTNLERNLTDRFKLGTDLRVSRTINEGTESGGRSWGLGVPQAVQLFPALFAPRNAEDEYTNPRNTYYPLVAGNLENPLALVNEISSKTQMDRVLGGVSAEYSFQNSLTLEESFRINYLGTNRERYESSELIYASRYEGEALTYTRDRLILQNELLAKYNETLNRVHDFDVTAGFTVEYGSNKTHFLRNANFANDITQNDDIGAGNLPGGPDVSSYRGERTLISQLGRVNYSYDDRYLATLTARMDGSSKFGAGNKWAFFPSGAFAWRISSESFMQGLDFLSNLKLRTSYGWSGNSGFDPYVSLARLSTAYYTFGGQRQLGYVPSEVANPTLRWEHTRGFDLGLDVGLFDQRIQLTADYYFESTDDLILPVTLPFESGFERVQKNTGDIQNTGIELALSADLLRGDFSWSTDLNFSSNRNEVTDLGESSSFYGPTYAAVNGLDRGGLVEEGRPLGVFEGYKTDGIFADQDAVDAHGAQPDAQPGGIRFVDVNDDGKITSADRTVIGNPYPDFTYGITNNISFKGLELSVFLQGAVGADVLNPALVLLEAGYVNSDYGLNSTVRRFEGRWTPENKENATFPRAGYSNVSTRNMNDRIIEDGTYLRIQNVTLSYEVPRDLLRFPGGVNMRMVRLFVKGSNLITFTDYIGYHPDVNTHGRSTINRGVDLGAYPATRRLTAGIRIGL